MSSLKKIKGQVRECLAELYQKDAFLFKRNQGNGAGERCLVFRLAYYLQNQFDSYYVDCDFNSSWEYTFNERGVQVGVVERSGKSIRNPDGSETGRFIDIIIHRRELNEENDIICFEIKKWNNCSFEKIAKDYNNLKEMTSTYGYAYGFHLILGKSKNKTKWSIFQVGRKIIDADFVFEQEGS